MRILIQTLGSAGDVHPFLALGGALRDRGHEVHLLGNEVFAEAAAKVGVSFEADSTREDYETTTRHPDLWNPRKGLRLIMERLAGPYLRTTVERIEGRLPETDCIVASTLGIASRVVRETHTVPLVTAHLAPSAFRSSVRMPRFEGMFVGDGSPRLLKAAWWKLVDFMVRRAMGPGLNALRAERGLPPEHRVFDTWLHSPDRTLGLFPDWFGPPQPDWPAGVALTGFPLFGTGEAPPLSDDLSAWLDAGPAPVVFTGGSANMGGARFYEEAIRAIRARGARGVLVAPNRDVVPRELGDAVWHASYVPFESLFPRAAALVSHGGVGTCAQALHAGLPHLVASLAFDQVDNASRLVDLGAGLWISRKRFRGKRADAALDELVSRASLRERAESLRAQVDPAAARARACELIESAVLERAAP